MSWDLRMPMRDVLQAMLPPHISALSSHLPACMFFVEDPLVTEALHKAFSGERLAGRAVSTMSERSPVLLLLGGDMAAGQFVIPVVSH